MTEFKVAAHSVATGRQVIEIHHQKLGLLGVIYPSSQGVRIVSKYFAGKELDVLLEVSPEFPPALEINIEP